jgi:SAM-dependent methyltransferase
MSPRRRRRAAYALGGLGVGAIASFAIGAEEEFAGIRLVALLPTSFALFSYAFAKLVDTRALRVRRRLRSLAAQLDANDWSGLACDLEDAILAIDSMGSGTAWKRGAAEEVAFWRRYLEAIDTADASRLDPKRPLSPHMRELIGSRPGERVEILDVGAGPLSTIGRVWEGREIAVTAVDPLAAHYDRLLREVGIDPPVRTVFGEAESLSSQFDRGRFDLIACTNALDHCRNPLKAIREMLRVSKRGGCIRLYHHVNEAEREDHVGFHQWNLWSHGGHFVIWNERIRCLVDRMLVDRATVEVDECSGDLIMVTIRKVAD